MTDLEPSTSVRSRDAGPPATAPAPTHAAVTVGAPCCASNGFRPSTGNELHHSLTLLERVGVRFICLVSVHGTKCLRHPERHHHRLDPLKLPPGDQEPNPVPASPKAVLVQQENRGAIAFLQERPDHTGLSEEGRHEPLAPRGRDVRSPMESHLVGEGCTLAVLALDHRRDLKPLGAQQVGQRRQRRSHAEGFRQAHEPPACPSRASASPGSSVTRP